MKKILQILTKSCLLLIVIYSVIQCSTLQKNKSIEQFKLNEKNANEFSVMGMNVENLFDEKHDEGKNDFTYLPLQLKNSKAVIDYCQSENISYRRQECFNLNWDSELVEFKLSQIASVINNTDHCPDTVLFIEVENISILHRLNQKLANCNYQTEVLIEGKDDRGIDLGLLSKFAKASDPYLIPLELKSTDINEQKIMDQLRGLLIVPLRTPQGAPVTIIGAHLPSQNNPREWRKQAIGKIKQVVSELNKKTDVIALGDFNISKTEDEETGFIAQELSQIGFISHLIGCQHCEGSHYFRQSWSFLDLIISGKNNQLIKIQPETITTIKTNLNSDQFGRPLRFNAEKKIGVSDHLPLFARFQVNSK